MTQEITECIYCGRYCKLTEPNCERGQELARKIQEGTFNLETAMKEREAHKHDGGEREHGSHHNGDHPHGEHHHHKGHGHHHN